MSSSKTPEEAARRAEQRAKSIEAQHSPGSTPTAFTSEEILAALQDNEIGDSRLLIKGMKDRFVFDGIAVALVQRSGVRLYQNRFIWHWLQRTFLTAPRSI
jgi:hypothetical protein